MPTMKGNTTLKITYSVEDFKKTIRKMGFVAYKKKDRQIYNFLAKIEKEVNAYPEDWSIDFDGEFPTFWPENKKGYCEFKALDCFHDEFANKAGIKDKDGKDQYYFYKSCNVEEIEYGNRSDSEYDFETITDAPKRLFYALFNGRDFSNRERKFEKIKYKELAIEFAGLFYYYNAEDPKINPDLKISRRLPTYYEGLAGMIKHEAFDTYGLDQYGEPK
jgi:hypothetical protein